MKNIVDRFLIKENLIKKIYYLKKNYYRFRIISLMKIKNMYKSRKFKFKNLVCFYQQLKIKIKK